MSVFSNSSETRKLRSEWTRDISSIGKYFYENSNIYLNRKKEIFDNVKDNLKELKSKVWKHNWKIRKKTI